MKYNLSLLLIALIFLPFNAICQDLAPEKTEVWEPIPELIEPIESFKEPPSDAIILFDGNSLDNWETLDGHDVEWIIENDYMTVKPGTGDIKTKYNFKDVHLYLEWKTPGKINGELQGYGNSGVFLQERYEIQIFEYWDNPTYSNGMVGSIYKQHIPLANPSRKPGKWQSYEIFYKAPVFSDNQILEEPARITVLFNGVLIHNNVEIFGSTVYRGKPSYEYHDAAGIRLQEHSDEVSFRNIWVREPDETISKTDGIFGNR
jgi:hypothetical protein